MPLFADRHALFIGYGASLNACIAFETSVTTVAFIVKPGDDLVSQIHGIGQVSQLLSNHDDSFLLAAMP